MATQTAAVVAVVAARRTGASEKRNENRRRGKGADSNRPRKRKEQANAEKSADIRARRHSRRTSGTWPSLPPKGIAAFSARSALLRLAPAFCIFRVIDEKRPGGSAKSPRPFGLYWQWL